MLKYLKIALILSSTLISLFWTNVVCAEDFRTDYKVQYFLSEGKDNLDVKVRFEIKIANFFNDVVLDRFKLSFPKSFDLRNVKALTDTGPVPIEVSTDDRNINLELKFSKPLVGRNEENNIEIEFNQDNLFKINGNVWEVILPIIQDRPSGNYDVVVNLPPNSDKRISISKPKPDLIRNNQITWSNPAGKTIYAVFGDKQYYELKLGYNLENKRQDRVYFDVAFPPDTLYQKIYLDMIRPEPDLIFSDEDGNYMGRYYLDSKEKKSVVFLGVAEISSKPRDELKIAQRESYPTQKNYLLTSHNFWQLNNIDQIKDLQTTEDIYNFTVKTLSYDFNKLYNQPKRVGAAAALRNPINAVCTEFSDVFVSVAREKGVSARELQGFGYSDENRLRPLSRVKDILHSWPEYYDEEKNLWIPVDPTWEDTSGIDYFNSLDLNHIVFAIHGRKDDYPLPAGAYKTESTKDVDIKVYKGTPYENSKIVIDSISDPEKKEGARYNVKLKIRNVGNVYAWNLPVELRSDSINIYPQNLNLNGLAPHQEREYNLELEPKSGKIIKNGNIEAFVLGEKVHGSYINFGSSNMGLVKNTVYAILVFLGIYLLLQFKKNKK